MEHIRTELGYKRTFCDCPECASYCSYLPGALIPSDLEKIAALLGYDNIETFAVENLAAGPGATVIRNGSQMQIPTLTPQRTPTGACKFLKDNRCSIHAHSPYSCAMFDCKQSDGEAYDRRVAGLRAICEEWANGGLYARTWMLLHSMGLVAPSAMEAKERWRKEMEPKE